MKERKIPYPNQLLSRRLASEPRLLLALPFLILGGIAAPWVALSLPWDPDESRYLEIAREMSQGGEWLVPTLNGVHYLEKPPLYLWALAGAIRLVGPSALAGRMISLISAAGVIGIVVWMGRRAGGWRQGLLAGLTLATCPLFAVLSTIITIDMFLTFWLTAGIAAFASGITPSEASRARRTATVLLGYLLLGLAVLAKGPVALAVPGLIWIFWRPPGADGSWLSRWAILPPRLLSGGFLFLAVAAPWFVYASWRFPPFADFFFVRGHLDRFAGEDVQGINFHEEPAWFYMQVMLGGAFPWIIHLAAPWSAVRGDLRAGSWPRLAWSWLLGGLAFFSVAAGKLPTYMLPLLPGAALLVSRRWDESLRGSLPRPWQTGQGILILAAAASLAAVVSFLVFLPADVWWSPLVDGAAVTALGALLCAGAALSLGFLLYRSPRSAFAALLAGAACVLAGGAWPKAAIDRSDSVEALALAVKEARRPDDAVVCVHKYLPLFAFHLGEPVLVVGNRGELAFGSKELGERPELFLDLARLRERVRGEGRVFLTVSKRRAATLRRVLEAELHVLGSTRNTILFSNRPQPWPLPRQP